MARFIIHRGTHQIGGMCAEICTDKSRVIIDLGANLPGSGNNGANSDAELIRRVFGKAQPVDAVLFTHYHGDHIGLMTSIPEYTDNIYMGETAQKIALAVAERTDKLPGHRRKAAPVIKKMKLYPKNESLVFGDIRVTPIPVGHSALDAYMFFIEAEGKTMLYTGDFRDHGIDGDVLYDNIERTVTKGETDVLVTEGTMLSRDNKELITEERLSEMANEQFCKKKYNFILMSSTNIDSIVWFYNAVPKGMHFVCDDYQYEILEIVNEYGRKENKRYILDNMKNIVKIQHSDTGLNTELDDGFVMLVRARGDNPRVKDKFREYIQKYCENDEAQIIYSMWDGYREKDKPYTNNNIISMLEMFDSSKVVPLHTSGHASMECIKKLIEKTSPGYIIPMHSEGTDKMKNIPEFAKYRDRIRVLCDGDVYDLDSNEKLENLYYDICHFSGDDNNMLAGMVWKLLDKNKDSWVKRFRRYAKDGRFSEKEGFLEKNCISIEPLKSLRLYSPVSSGVRTVQLRYSGALIAHLAHRGEKRGWELYPEKAAENFTVYDNGTAVKLNTYIKNHSTENGGGANWEAIRESLEGISCRADVKLVQEHILESMIYDKLESGEFLGLQPVYLVKAPDKGCRFQMPVPFNASSIASDSCFKYLKTGKGNVDILARTADSTLTVIELKDSYCPEEKPSKAIKQAIIYAAFLGRLINTPNAGDWAKLFGIEKTDIVNAVICMPWDNAIEDDRDFSSDTVRIGGLTIKLHYIYLNEACPLDGKISVEKTSFKDIHQDQ